MNFQLGEQGIMRDFMEKRDDSINHKTKFKKDRHK